MHQECRKTFNFWHFSLFLKKASSGELRRWGIQKYLCGRALKLQQHQGAGTLHNVEVEEERLAPVKKTAQNATLRASRRR